MRGGFQSAARWNQHFTDQARKFRDSGIAALRAREQEIQSTFTPLEADNEAFWSIWYDWQKGKPDVNIAMEGAYYYGRGDGSTGTIYAEFVRIVRRQPE